MSADLARALVADLDDDAIAALAERLRPVLGQLGGGPADSNLPALHSVATVARLLDRSPRTVRRRIADQSLPAVLDHGRVMVRGDDLRAYVEGLDRLGSTRPAPARGRRTSSNFDFLHK